MQLQIRSAPESAASMTMYCRPYKLNWPMIIDTVLTVDHEFMYSENIVSTSQPQHGPITRDEPNKIQGLWTLAAVSFFEHEQSHL